MARRKPDRVYVVSDVADARSLDMAARRRSYLLRMGIRVVLFIVAILVPGPLRWVALVGALVLPWTSVIRANGVGPPPTRMAEYVVGDHDRMLTDTGGATHPGGVADADGEDRADPSADRSAHPAGDPPPTGGRPVT